MPSSPLMYEIEILSSKNYGKLELAAGDDEVDNEGNIEVTLGYKSFTINDDGRYLQLTASTGRMDPYYDDRENRTDGIDDRVANEKGSRNEITDESNPADCSTILSECFSGEDTAEATIITNANGPLVLDDTQTHFSIHREDGISNVVLSPSPLRYFTDNDNYERTSPVYFDELQSSPNTANNASSKRITRRYPKDPTTTPNRPKSTINVAPSMAMGTTTWGDPFARKADILERYHPSIEVAEASVTSYPNDYSSSSVQQQSATESKEIHGEGTYHKDGNNGGEDEDADDDEEEELSWRMNPNKSMSDWTIEIQIKVVGGSNNNNNNNTRSTLLPSNGTIYHVHKSVLAVGPRRSQYFVKLFRSNVTVLSTTTNNHTTTILEMDKLTAMSFPILLDYMYGTKSDLVPITTYNATALHVLAQQLEMKHLRTIVRNFWMQDLSMENIAIYYQHASSPKIYHNTLVNCTQNTDVKGGGLDDPLIIRALEMYCAQHMFDVDSGNCTIADILDLLDPQFLYNVIVQAHDNNEKFRMMNHGRDDNENTFSLRLSLIVAVYCNIHYVTDLDVTMFQQLTDRRHLPVLESQAAKVFLELQEKLLGVPNASVTSLTDRCISVLANQWDDACIKKSDKNSDLVDQSIPTVVLPRLESMALVTFVSQALLNANERISELESKNVELQTRNIELKQIVELTQCKVNTLEQANENLQRQLREMQKDMVNMKSSAALTDQSLCNTTVSSTATTGSKNSRGRHSVTVNENCINGVEHAEFTDDEDDDAYETTRTITTTMNIPTRDCPSLPSSSASASSSSSRVVLHQQQSQQRNAIDHGRLLLRRLDSPITATTSSNPL